MPIFLRRRRRICLRTVTPLCSVAHFAPRNSALASHVQPSLPAPSAPTLRITPLYTQHAPHHTERRPRNTSVRTPLSSSSTPFHTHHTQLTPSSPPRPAPLPPQELARLEELIDSIKLSGPGEQRRDGLLQLATSIIADPIVVSFANHHGARQLLMKGLDGAVKRGDEELMDAISAAVAEESRSKHTTDAVELMAVAGSQVRTHTLFRPWHTG